MDSGRLGAFCWLLVTVGFEWLLSSWVACGADGFSLLRFFGFFEIAKESESTLSEYSIFLLYIQYIYIFILYI